MNPAEVSGRVLFNTSVSCAQSRLTVPFQLPIWPTPRLSQTSLDKMDELSGRHFKR